MIQTILFFLLGFLCAGFLALMVAPAVWRRAVVLTRKRIEASVPLTLNEIQADKDRMRAEFAMSTRRLEMSIKAFKEKAAAQIVEINRNREQLKALADERDQKNRAITELEGQAGELRAELRTREDRLQQLSDRLAETQERLEERSLELDRISQAFDEAAFSSSSRQIELVARETEVEKLATDLSVQRNQRKDHERRARELASELKSAQEALKAEKRKAADLEKRLDRTVTALSDREEKLDLREKELATLREQLKGGASQSNALEEELADAQKAKVKLEAEVADLSLQLSNLLSGAKGGDIEKAMEKLSRDRERLEGRLKALNRENKKLRGEMAAYQNSRAEDWSDERRGNALLREQINDLAAEVVNLTALLDGPDSPVRKVLEEGEQGTVVSFDTGERIVSLADRVRALQKAAASAN